MAKCYNCGAPLPLRSNLCSYCNSINDIDLQRNVTYSDSDQYQDRCCPRCNCGLKTIDLTNNGALLIERCERCFGLFFDIGELEAYLDTSNRKNSDINYQIITTITNENHHQEYPVMYLRCPVCKDLMNRINYGKKSGVVVNKCLNHGIWLDSGCLNHLVGWARAGGMELDRIYKEEAKEQEIKRQQTKESQKKLNQDIFCASQKEVYLDDLIRLIKKILRG